MTGNLERLQRYSGDEQQAARSIDNALVAIERAAKLTSQLLAFARKQPLLVEPVDVNQTVRELCPMIERTAGGNVVVDAKLWPEDLVIEIDQNQLESALLNLALNARDAMPSGGCLEIVTARKGDQVTVTVGDTGTGMDSDTLTRATEPFFTTKPVGAGTGLGLSQVYGFVTQSGGQVEIQSSVGTGTSVTLSFPRSKGGADDSHSGG